jgi:hypothetical protein
MTQQARQKIAVRIDLPVDGIDRTSDARIIHHHRPVLPEGIVALMRQPLGQDGRRRLQAGEPHVLPAVADDGRVRGSDQHGLELGAPIVIVQRESAPHIVRVVRVSIVRGALGNNGLERGRRQRGRLQGIETAPGNAAHPHAAIGPGLASKPGDDFHGVILLLLQIFAEQYSVGISGAADVDAHEGESVWREGLRPTRVALSFEVPLAVRQVFPHDGNRRRRRVDGHPDSRGQARTVLERYPFVLERRRRWRCSN